MTASIVSIGDSASGSCDHENNNQESIRTGQRPRIWSLASGSGGVGRSTLATVLGSRLVQRGGSACLVDGDWSSPLLTLLLDVAAQPDGNLWSGGPLRPVRSSEHEDLQVISGSSPLGNPPLENDSEAVLERLGALEHDNVVVDLPAGAHAASLNLWLGSDLPLLVAVPERLPLEATARLLARIFARLITPWLAQRVGREEALAILSGAWEQCAGRTGTWMRAVARLARLEPEEITAHVGSKPIHLILNRVRRADDIDVGHALVTAAGHGLGLDLRFRAVLPFEDEGWIRGRRLSVQLPGVAASLLNVEIDDFIDRIETDSEVPAPQAWGWQRETDHSESLVGR